METLCSGRYFNDNYTNRHYNGSVSTIKTYNRVLTDDEITAVYAVEVVALDPSPEVSITGTKEFLLPSSGGEITLQVNGKYAEGQELGISLFKGVIQITTGYTVTGNIVSGGKAIVVIKIDPSLPDGNYT